MIINLSINDEIKHLSKKYGYKEWMIARFMHYIPDLERFLDSIESFEHKYIRLNTLKRDINYIKGRLESKGFELKKSSIEEVYEVKGVYPLGATTEYLLGYYYIQDLSSCFAVKALDATSNENNIDMCAAPGGKSTYIAQIMNNQGLLISIEARRDRLTSLISNLQRCGVTNTYVFNLDASQIDFGIKFDKVMLDAPCSGEGIIAKDLSRKQSREPQDIEYCSSIQRRLIERALKIVKDDGTIVYSTCSLAPEENEMIIDDIIKRYNVRIEALPYGSEALGRFGDIKFDDQVRNARRFYPHLHNTLGFFIAKIRV